jgi:hypothetical protein
MLLTFAKPVDGFDGNKAAVWRYEIRSRGRASVRAAIVDPPETRKTPSGELVVWDLVMRGPETSSTKKVVRCASK